jgi:hypothetical protein
MRVAVFVCALVLIGIHVKAGFCRADCVQYDDYIHWTGSVGVTYPAIGVAVAGGYAYVADQDRCLEVVRVTNPQYPRVVGRTDFRSYALDVAVAGGYAYVAARLYGLQVVDVSDPRNPTLVSTADAGFANAVAISGNYAYVACWGGGFCVIDIADPLNPTAVGHSGPADCWALAVSGRYAYVGSEGLAVIDISNPDSPNPVGGVGTMALCRGVAVSGNYAYLAEEGGFDDGCAFQVADVTDPTNPRIVGEPIRLEGMGLSAAVVGNRVLIGTIAYWTASGSLYVFDITNPEAPRMIGSTYGGYANDVAIADDLAYVADQNNALHILDIGHPASPPAAPFVPTSIPAEAVAVSGNCAYVAEYGGWNLGRLEAVDIADPANPQVIGAVDTRASCIDVAVSGSHAYVLETPFGPEGLQVVDVSDPRNPRITGSVGISQPLGMDAVGSLVYVAGMYGGSGTGYLDIVDASDPESPQIIGQLDTPSEAHDVKVSGNFAYLQENEVGVRVIDISNPTAPRSVATLVRVAADPIPYRIFGYGCVGISGTHAYMLGRENRLDVIDIADPLHPWTAGHVDVPYQYIGVSTGLAVSGGAVYLPCTYRNVAVIDVGDPAYPRYLGDVHTGASMNVAVVGDRLLVASKESGVEIASAQCGGRAGSARWASARSAPEEFWVTPIPASGPVSFHLTLPSGGSVRTALYDVTGRKVRTLFDGFLGSGAHDLRWDGSGEDQRPVPPGVYLARVSTEVSTRTARVVILR